jgi:hypothetical protein
MIPLAVALTLLAANGHVVITEAVDVSSEEVARIVARIEAASAPLDARDASAEAPAIRLLGIPSTIRVIVVIKGETRRLDLMRDDPGSWDPALDALAAGIWADTGMRVRSSTPSIERMRPLPETLAAPPPGVSPPAQPETSVAPWLILGGSAVVTCVAVGFGIANHNAVSEGTTSPDPVRVMDLQHQTRVTGLTADILYGVAAAGFVLGGLLMALD